METPDKVDCLFVFEKGSINTIIKEHNGPIYNGKTNGSNYSEQLEEGDEAIVDALNGIFYGDTELASEFLVKVKNMKPTSICKYVKQLVGQSKISEMSYKKDLWKILNDNGLYEPTLRNWTDQVSI